MTIDSHFQEFRKRLMADGHFRYPRARIALMLSRLALLSTLAILLSPRFPVASVIVLTIATIDATWWIHDVGHDAIFKSKRQGLWAIETLGILFLGMPQNAYHHDIHRRHHGSTNVLGRDLALDTHPIAWDESQITEGWKPFLLLQPYIWYFIVLPLAFFLLNGGSVIRSFRKRQWLILFALVLRWAAVLALFSDHLAMAWAPPVIAGFVLAFMASLNHFHLPITARPSRSQVASVFERTQNVSIKSPLWTWLSGGLNFHIEHHLFPDMPSRSYPRISHQVREFARQHGLIYREAGLGEILPALHRKLENPGGLPEVAVAP